VELRCVRRPSAPALGGYLKERCLRYMPWTAIAYVGSGITLAAFIVAVAAWVYRTKILERERTIRSAPDQDRAVLIERTLEFFDIETAQLTREQKYNLALHQIRERARRFRLTTIVVITIACLAAGVSVFAILRTPTEKEPSENKNSASPTPSAVSSQNQNVTPINNNQSASTLVDPEIRGVAGEPKDKIQKPPSKSNTQLRNTEPNKNQPISNVEVSFELPIESGSRSAKLVVQNDKGETVISTLMPRELVKPLVFHLVNNPSCQLLNERFINLISKQE
jgi:hypothetical protein